MLYLSKDPLRFCPNRTNFNCTLNLVLPGTLSQTHVYLLYDLFADINPGPISSLIFCREKRKENFILFAEP
ncbi:hypothetical protein DPV73_07675 [Leptospira mayottensis]|nr:hypothetical protein DPV73_07675 [Leptospira mayottensis]